MTLALSPDHRERQPGLEASKSFSAACRDLRLEIVGLMEPRSQTRIVSQMRNLTNHTPYNFDSINSDLIRSCTMRTTGAAVPSGLNAHKWRRLYASVTRDPPMISVMHLPL